MATNVHLALTPDYEIRMRFGYDKALTEKVKETFEFAAYRPSQKCWDIPPTPRNVAALSALVEEVNAHKTFSLPLTHRLWQKFQQARVRASQAVVGPGLDIRDWHGTLRAHQQAGVMYMVRTRRCLVTDQDAEDRRLQALAAVAYLRAFPAVIVTPAARRQSWLDLIAARLPSARVAIVEQREGQVLEGARLYLVSDAVLDAWRPLLKQRRPRTVIVDEADRFLDWTSQRTKALRALVKGTSYRFLLTSWPVHNWPGDVLTLLGILGLVAPVALVLAERLREQPPDDSWKYLSRLRDTQDEHVLAELNRALRVWGYLRREPEDLVLQMDERDRRFVPVALADFAAYQAVEWKFVLEFPSTGKRVHGPHIFQRLAALRREVGRQKWPEARAFLERLSARGEKVVVVTYHQEIAKWVGEHFGWPLITGSTSKKRRQERIRTFQEDPAAQGLVVGMETGLDTPLPAARHMVFLELGWRWVQIERLEQLGAAGGRGIVWYLVAPDTVDMHMLSVLARKKRLLEALTDAVQEDDGTPGLTEDAGTPIIMG